MSSLFHSFLSQSIQKVTKPQIDHTYFQNILHKEWYTRLNSILQTSYLPEPQNVTILGNSVLGNNIRSYGIRVAPKTTEKMLCYDKYKYWVNAFMLRTVVSEARTEMWKTGSLRASKRTATTVKIQTSSLQEGYICIISHQVYGNSLYQVLGNQYK